MDIIGNRFLVNFGMAKAILHFRSETEMTFTITEKDGEAMNETEAVTINMHRLRPDLYMLAWKEKNGNTVTQVHDYTNGIVYSNWTLPDGTFNNVQGTIQEESTETLGTP